MDIDFYVINTRSDEILVRNRDAHSGIVGFFLTPGEEYHFNYHIDVTFRDERNDLSHFHIFFDFYASGEDSSFTEYIGDYLFILRSTESYAYSETCFVR